MLLDLAGTALLFLVGLGMSAFFSGSETAFYRLSTVRLTIDANAGDRAARRLLRFTQRPGQFVATTLVGNNVANYLVSAATGLAVGMFVSAGGGFAEVAATWLVTPIVFVGGELLPKNLCYLAPGYFLRRGLRMFRLFYWVFLPVSFPLAAMSRLLERLTGATAGPVDLVFGRSRLTEVLREGRQAGLLTDAQSRFLTGLLATGADTVAASMTPADRVPGLPEGTNRNALLDHARRHGITEVVLAAADGQWQRYVRVTELALLSRTDLGRPLPQFDQRQTQLDVLLALRTAGEPLGAVLREGRVVGIVNERSLIEQLFRAGRPLALAPAR